jgi:acetyl-CoA synthetase
MLQAAQSHGESAAAFRWRIPEIFNIAGCLERHARLGNYPAIVLHGEDGRERVLGYRDLDRASNRFANALRARGVQRGDRVAILLPQSFETAIAHFGTYKLGAIALPLFTLFGPDALAYRLGHSGARALVTDGQNWAKIDEIKERLPDLTSVFLVDGAPAGTYDFAAELARAKEAFTTLATSADDPAIIIYTSGTTGPPKGALHGHRVLLGHLPGVELTHDFFPQPGDKFWTPADWAWIGGLIDVLLPALFHGVTVVAHRARKFDPAAAMTLIEQHEVRNVFAPPTALKIMRAAAVRPAGLHRLRSLASGGESLGAEMLDWARVTFGVDVNEFYGQTECNMVVGNVQSVMQVRPGSMGRAVPGHKVAIVDDAGHPLPPGETGNIAIARPDPVMFLGYWRNEAATREKFAADWLLTGDLGRADPDGYLYFVGRADDVITSGGYRIGPAEIEDCLVRHPAVAMAAAVGVPDPTRTEIVKAFVVLRPGYEPSPALAQAIQVHVRARLAAHEYPREIEFVAELPLTATGKIVRRELRAREVLRRTPAD